MFYDIRKLLLNYYFLYIRDAIIFLQLFFYLNQKNIVRLMN